MTVYVDELRVWVVDAPRPFHRGSCHLWADTLDELHAFAARLGMRRAWFQDHRSLPHYDLTPRRRDRALALGAVFKPGREAARERREARLARQRRNEVDGGDL